MKASPDAQLRLLDLQELDTALEQLAHRRRNLPELAEIDRLSKRVNELRDEVVAAETQAGDISKEQSKAEADVDQVRSRTERDQKRLDSGQVASPRELENLQSEIASLQERQAELEDVVLEIMERRDQTEQQRARSEAQRAEVADELAQLEQRRDETFAEIDGQVAEKQHQREVVAGEIPQELLSLYEKLRTQTGIGAAALYRGRCEGCHLSLTTINLNNIRNAADDDVMRCEECRRILVRTKESGQ